MLIHATTAQFPGFSYAFALEQIHSGVQEGIWGSLSSHHVQICPQSSGVITEDVAGQLREKYPHTKLRLHANARVQATHRLWDLSTVTSETLPYFEDLFSRQRQFQSPMMSLHAGYQQNCTQTQLWDNIHRLRDLAQRYNTDVCVEGLYPNPKRPQWIDRWQDFEHLLHHRIPYALDLSHMKIIAQKQGWQNDLLQALLSSPLCQEVHVSDNNGQSDRHDPVLSAPHWHRFLPFIHSSAVVFSEGCLTRPIKPPRQPATGIFD